MRAVLGALAGLAGAAAGGLIATILAAVFAKAANVTTREGAAGYLVVAVGILGALAGLVVGVVLYARSAPAGEGPSAAGSALLGLLGVVVVVAAILWAWTLSHEGPASYGDTLASLELELRVKKADAPAGPPSSWLDVEVQTAKTRPAAVVLSDKVREEGDGIVVPLVQNPLHRATGRLVVVRVADRHVEVFSPRWKAKPDPKADWSPWIAPRLAEKTGGEGGEAVRPILELRYRVRLYGD
ncbi:MAG TPA: hypothetical protein PLP50_14820 [Thermoanaerobaculia bacterium]|nr:hypothetical protein [Thermoanaerobaculia bacterium]HQN09210.1 hypothetical protein [Thermoanaerobaculia bacterium]HQP88116.1 hypothetical protein [Thermoanaerobaculia bacterium]